MGLALGADREVLVQEIPDVDHQVVLEGTGPRVEVETARTEQADRSLETAVGSGNDRGRELAAGDGLVQGRDHVAQERDLVLGEAVQPDHERITLPGVEAGRQVDVDIAPFAKGRRPEAVIRAVIMSEVEDAAGETAIDAVQGQAVADRVGPGLRTRQDQQDEEEGPAETRTHRGASRGAAVGTSFQPIPLISRQ